MMTNNEGMDRRYRQLCCSRLLFLWFSPSKTEYLAHVTAKLSAYNMPQAQRLTLKMAPSFKQRFTHDKTFMAFPNT